MVDVRSMAIVILASAATAALPTFAQSGPSHPLVGAWERVSVTTADGRTADAPSAFLIFTADGFFAQLAIAPDRPQVNKPLAQFTREELVSRFGSVAAGHGTYKVEGDRMIRHRLRDANPNAEGTDEIHTFRFDGDMLVLFNLEIKSEARFRRAVRGPS